MPVWLLYVQQSGLEQDSAGVLISLGPKAFSVFAYLLQHRDRVVVKQELNDLLWPGQFVSDAALARCITLLRKAVGDTGKQQEIIKTLYGHGYRFIAGVDERPITPPASAGLTISIPPNSQALDPTDALPGFPLPDQDRPLQSEQSPLPVRDGVPQEVTVLCGTLAHTELLAARLTPEALHRLVCGFFEQAWQAVHRCGGIIQAFLDDGFLALFGAPLPCEDHAWRAVRAAIAPPPGLVNVAFSLDGIDDVVNTPPAPGTSNMLSAMRGSSTAWGYTERDGLKTSRRGCGKSHTTLVSAPQNPPVLPGSPGSDRAWHTLPLSLAHFERTRLCPACRRQRAAG